MLQELSSHPLMLAFCAFAVFNAAVQALEKPSAFDSPRYRFLYRFLHLLAFNFQYALTEKFPEYTPLSVAAHARTEPPTPGGGQNQPP